MSEALRRRGIQGQKKEAWALGEEVTLELQGTLPRTFTFLRAPGQTGSSRPRRTQPLRGPLPRDPSAEPPNSKSAEGTGLPASSLSGARGSPATRHSGKAPRGRLRSPSPGPASRPGWRETEPGTAPQDLSPIQSILAPRPSFPQGHCNAVKESAREPQRVGPRPAASSDLEPPRPSGGAQ